MKTYNGKNISIKQIQKVLRTMDKTQIFRIYFQIFGKIDRHKLHEFIIEYAPSKRVLTAAYYTAYTKRKPYYSPKYLEFFHDNKYQQTVFLFKEYLKDRYSPYFKRPIMGEKYLYFASPVYGLSDYNKSEIMPIEGNERFCETICKLADKYFN